MDREVERVVEAVHAVGVVCGTDAVQARIAAHDMLEARIADAIRQLDREGVVLEDGALDLSHWLRTRCGRADRDARRLAQRAARLTGCPALTGLGPRDSAVVVRHWKAHVDALVDGRAPGMIERAIYVSPGLDGGGELT